MSDRISSFRDLIVWQKSVDLSIAAYAITKRFPASERYALSSQTQRSAVSIPANIAEGHGKSGPNHFALHLSHARGSRRREPPWCAQAALSAVRYLLSPAVDTTSTNT